MATELQTLGPAAHPYPGLAFDPHGGLRVFFVREYFRDLEVALRRWLIARGLLSSGPPAIWLRPGHFGGTCC